MKNEVRLFLAALDQKPSRLTRNSSLAELNHRQCVTYPSIPSIPSIPGVLEIRQNRRNRKCGIERRMWNRTKKIRAPHSIHCVLRVSFTFKHKQDYGTVWISAKKKKKPARFKFSFDAASCSLSLFIYLYISFSLLCVRSMQRPHQSAPQPMSTGELPCSALTNLRPATHVDR